MKKSTGGYRAGVFETIQAAEKGAYVDKLLYAVEGLPGVWRRCKMPKGDPAASGLLPCWSDGVVVYLESAGAVNEELAHTNVTVENPTELAAFMDGLREKRAEAIIQERAADAAKPPKTASEPPRANPGPDNGAESAADPEPENTEAAADAPPAGEVDV